MRERRWPWTCASAVLLVSAFVGAAAVHLHWLPCRGMVLSGSLLPGFRQGPDLSDGCLQAMDDGFSFLYPPGDAERWGAESLYGLLAAALAGAAWLVVVLAAGWSRTTKLVATLPSVATGATVLFSLAAAGSGSDAELHAYSALLFAPNVLAVVGFVVVAVRESLPADVLLRVALLLCGTTAFGLIQAEADYILSSSLSYANWDTPPGAGYLTVLGMALVAAMVAVLTLRRAARRDPERVHAALSRPAETAAG